MTLRTRTPEGESFDDLARGLATGTVSRRRTLVWVGSSLFGGALGGVSLFGDAEAKSCKSKCNKKKDKKAKKKCKKKCEKQEQRGASLACQNLGTACGLGASTLVCNCRLTKEGQQSCANVVNPPNGVAFQSCTLTTDCPAGQICDFGGNVCRTGCPSS